MLMQYGFLLFKPCCSNWRPSACEKKFKKKSKNIRKKSNKFRKKSKNIRKKFGGICAKHGCFLPGSNRRPCACEAHVITATLRKLLYKKIHARPLLPYTGQHNFPSKKPPSHLGVEPRTFGLEVQRAIHCANGTSQRFPVFCIVLFPLHYRLYLLRQYIY